MEDYAQDLIRLYQWAYPHSERGSEEAERMGRQSSHTNPQIHRVWLQGRPTQFNYMQLWGQRNKCNWTITHLYVPR